ncbi:MAG: hypothetical protein KC656_28310 [Myxococcales bacterium]|nr:hypothetical protein [Myxococcales bacterium]
MRCSLVLAALVGCGHPYGDLATPQDWVPLDAAEDPFPDRPDTVDCPPAARVVEVLEDGQPALDVDTGTCRYLGVGQPLALDVRAGDLVELHLFHGALTAEEPAEAHCALRIGDWSVFDAIEPIPTVAVDHVETLEAPTDLPAGTPVVLHLHNHGANSWTFVSLRSLDPDAP